MQNIKKEDLLRILFPVKAKLSVKLLLSVKVLMEVKVKL
jgi:hypothetical protein